jgi:histone H3/H4
LFALGHGARGRRIDLAAIESFRRQFGDRIRSAVREPDWRTKWRTEEAYVRGYAGVVGERAARFARDEGRTVINKEDVDLALVKMRGYLPVAGRWCPP